MCMPGRVYTIGLDTTVFADVFRIHILYFHLFISIIHLFICFSDLWIIHNHSEVFMY